VYKNYTGYESRIRVRHKFLTEYKTHIIAMGKYKDLYYISGEWWLRGRAPF